jgi:hypothetical protein
VRLPYAETSFYFAALGQLDPAMQPVFTERVAGYLGAHPDPGPGDVDRAIRQALVGLWEPPFTEDHAPRWASASPRYEKSSKRDR